MYVIRTESGKYIKDQTKVQKSLCTIMKTKFSHISRIYRIINMEEFSTIYGLVKK